MPGTSRRNSHRSGAKRNARSAIPAPIPVPAAGSSNRRSSRVAGEAGPDFPVTQRETPAIVVPPSEDDVLVYLGKRDKSSWLKLRKQGKHDMADTLWQGKSLKALASRTAEAIIEDAPIEAGAATTGHTIKDWLTSFFSDLAVLHTEKIRHAVTLASNHVGDDKRGDEVIWSRAGAMDIDERSMKVRLLDKFEQAFQDSAACICNAQRV